MTKRLLSFVLAALMVFSMMPAIFATSKSNKDTHQVEGAEPTIEMKNTNFVSYLGIIKGYPNGSLGLDDPVTRWMMALLAIRVMTGDVDDTSWLPDITYTTRFEDVTDGDVASLYLGAIALCAEKGFIRGIEEGGKLYFKPYDTITYVDALVIAVRLLGYESDEMNAGYPTSYTEKAYALGLSEGIEGVALKDEITRETAFQLIYNVLFAKRANSDKTFQEENFPYHTVKFVCTNTGAVLKTYTVVHGSTLYQSTGLTPAGFDSLVPGRPAPSAVYYGGDDGVYWSLDPYGEQKLSRPESEYDRSHFARTATITEDTTLYIYYPEKDTKVEFVDADGNVIKTINGKGAFTVYTSDYPELPANTAKYTYTGWSKTGMFTVDNTTVRVTAVSSVNQYDVTFLDKDGNQIGDIQKVAYGTCPVYPTAPTVEGKSFAGWTVTPGTVITENTTIQATYDDDPVVWFNFEDKDGHPIANSIPVYLKKDVALTIPDANISGDYKFNKIVIEGLGEDVTTLADVNGACVVHVIYKTKTTDIGHFQAGVLVDESGNKFTLAEGVDLSALICDEYTSIVRYGVKLWDGVIDSASDVTVFAHGKFYSEAAAEYDDSYVAIDKDTLDENLQYNVAPYGDLYSLYLFDIDGDGDYDYAYTVVYDIASYVPGYIVNYGWGQTKSGNLVSIQNMTYATDFDLEVGSWMYIGWDVAKYAYVNDVLYSESAKEMTYANIVSANAATMTFKFEGDDNAYALATGYSDGYTFNGITVDELKDFLVYNFTREPDDPDHEYYYYAFDGMLVYLNEYGVWDLIIEEELTDEELNDVYVAINHLNTDYGYGFEWDYENFVYEAYKNGNEKVTVNALNAIYDYSKDNFFKDKYHDGKIAYGEFFKLSGRILVVDPVTGTTTTYHTADKLQHIVEVKNQVEYDFPYSDNTDCAAQEIIFKNYYDWEASEEAGEPVYKFGFTATTWTEGPYAGHEGVTDYYGGFISDDATFVISFSAGCFFAGGNTSGGMCWECPGCDLATREGADAKKVVVLSGKEIRTAWEALVADAEQEPDDASISTGIFGHVWYNNENNVWMIDSDMFYLGDVDLGFEDWTVVDGDYVFMLPGFAQDGVYAWEDAADGEHTIYTYKTTGLFDFYTGADYAGAEYVKSYLDFTKPEVVSSAMHKGYVITFDENGDAWFTVGTSADGYKYTLAYELLWEEEYCGDFGWVDSLEWIFNSVDSVANRNYVDADEAQYPTFNMSDSGFLYGVEYISNYQELLSEILSNYISSGMTVYMPYYGEDYENLGSILSDGGKSIASAVAKLALAASEYTEFYKVFEFESQTELVAFLLDVLADVIDNQTLVDLDVLTSTNYKEVDLSIGITNIIKQVANLYYTGECALTNDLTALMNVVMDVVAAIQDDRVANWAIYDYVEFLLAKAFKASAESTAANTVVTNIQFYAYDKETDTYVPYELVDGVDYYVEDVYDILWVFDEETGTLRGYFWDVDNCVKDYDYVGIVADGYVDLAPWVENSQDDGEYCYGYDYAYGIYDYVHDEYLADVEYWGEDFEMLIAEFKYNENVNMSAKVEWLTNVTWDADAGKYVATYEETDVILAYFVDVDEDTVGVAIANNDFYAAPYYGCTFGYPEYRVTVSCHAWTFTTNDADTVKFTYEYTPTEVETVWAVIDGYQKVTVKVLLDYSDNVTEDREMTVAELKEGFENGTITLEQLKDITWGKCPHCGKSASFAFDEEKTFNTCEHCGGEFMNTYTTEKWEHVIAAAKHNGYRTQWPFSAETGVRVVNLYVHVTANEDGTMPEFTITVAGEDYEFEATYDEAEGIYYVGIPAADITGDVVVTVAE